MKSFRLPETSILLLLLGITFPLYASPRPGAQEKENPPQEHEKPKPQEHSKPQPAQHPQQQEHVKPPKPEPAKPPQQTQQHEQHQQQEHAKQQQQHQQQEHAKQQEQHQQQQHAKQQQQSQQHAQEQQHAEQQQRQEQERAKQQQQAEKRAQQQQAAHEHSQQPRSAPVRAPVQQEQHRPASEQRVVWQQDRASNWQSEHRTWQQRGGYHGYRIPETRYRSYFGPSHGFRISVLPLIVVGGRPRFEYEGFWFSLVDPWPQEWTDDWYDTDDVYIEYYGDGYYLSDRRHPGFRIAIVVYTS